MSNSEKIPAGFNAGNTMLLLSQDYKHIKRVVNETIQNAVDASAKRVLVIINMKSMSLNVFDDGLGCTKEEFKKKIQNIGSSLKTEEGQGGKCGTGNLAALGIMGEGGTYKFISRSVNKSRVSNPYFAASIDYDTLHGSKDVYFDFVDLPANHSFRGWDAPVDVSQMTSYVKCTGIQKSAVKSWLRDDPSNAVKEMCEFIGSGTYAPIIKAKNTKITVYLVPKEGINVIRDVEMSEFKGRKEDLITIKTDHGPVVFEMYTTIVPVNDPVIKVRHRSVVDIDIKDIQDVWAKHKKTFNSGYMQGYVHLNFCDINAERTDFQWTDERLSFAYAIDEFVDDYATECVDRAKKAEEYDRHRLLANKAMNFIDEFLRENPAFLSPEFCGAVSDRHIDVKGKKVQIGQQLSPRDDGDDEESDRRPRLRSKKAQKEKKIAHVSSDAPTGRGTDRNLIRGQSGACMRFVSPEQAESWRKKLDGGAVLINMDHKDFVVASQKSHEAEIEYYRLLVLGALVETRLVKEFGDKAAEHFHEGFENMALMAGLINHK